MASTEFPMVSLAGHRLSRVAPPAPRGSVSTRRPTLQRSTVSTPSLLNCTLQLFQREGDAILESNLWGKSFSKKFDARGDDERALHGHARELADP